MVAREPGAEHPAIPTWASHGSNPASIGSASDARVTRVEIDSVPGAFQLLNVLTPTECGHLVEMTETLGYLEDAAVSLPRSVRHNHNATWIADDHTNQAIWDRCESSFSADDRKVHGKKALGLNARYRFYRYAQGDYFAPHTDGSWPGSRMVDGKLITNAYEDRWSMLTVLLFLTQEFEGGATRFFVSRVNPTKPARSDDDVATIDIRTPLGGALCFPHGTHPLHCMHASEPITSGLKYIIRSDILFEL